MSPICCKWHNTSFSLLQFHRVSNNHHEIAGCIVNIPMLHLVHCNSNKFCSVYSENRNATVKSLLVWTCEESNRSKWNWNYQNAFETWMPPISLWMWTESVWFDFLQKFVSKYCVMKTGINFTIRNVTIFSTDLLSLLLIWIVYVAVTFSSQFIQHVNCVAVHTLWIRSILIRMFISNKIKRFFWHCQIAASKL